jgi:hypothetical protein
MTPALEAEAAPKKLDWMGGERGILILLGPTAFRGSLEKGKLGRLRCFIWISIGPGGLAEPKESIR